MTDEPITPDILRLLAKEPQTPMTPSEHLQTRALLLLALAVDRLVHLLEERTGKDA